MDALFRRLGDVNAGAFAVLALLYAALLAEGANTAASAALLSALLGLTLALTAFGASRNALGQLWRTHWISIGAAFVFISVQIATLLPANLLGLEAHPAWARAEAPTLSLSPYRTIEGLIAFAGACAAFALGALLNSTSEARSWGARWLIILGALYVLAGFYLFFAGRSGARLDVGISSANVAASFFGMLMLGAAAMLARAWRGADRIDRGASMSGAAKIFNAPLSLATLILAFAALLLTASRGGLIATFLGFVAFFALLAATRLSSSGARLGAAVAPLALVIGVITLLFARGGEDVMARFALADDDWGQRKLLVEAHWPFVLDRPWLGHGLNTYHELNTQAFTEENWRALLAAGSAHNIFVQTLEETGAIGLGLFALMLGAPIVLGLLRITQKRSGREWAASAVAMSVLILSHGLVDFSLQTPALGAFYAFVLGAWTSPQSG